MKSPGTIVRIYFRKPIVEFFETEASGGIMLIAATVLALAWANSPFREGYDHFWHTYVGLSWGGSALKLSLQHWINDGLMAVFFFFVGLEIKRELLTGELSSARKAALPAMAAVGGMVVPAAIYALLNTGGPGIDGWGIPMATDIAFALGVLMLLGDRVPVGLKVFLTALAVVDDLGAVLVIAVFYTAQLDWQALGLGFAVLALLVALGRMGVRRRAVFAILGVVVWYFFLKSGVHATVAGVLAALTVPHRIARGRGEMLERLDDITDDLDEREAKDLTVYDEHHEAALQEIQKVADQAGSPLQHMEHDLAPWVAYGIMPVFALANAGVALSGDVVGGLLTDPVAWGVVLGLVVGKQLGVLGFAWAAVKLGWANLPSAVDWRLIHGASALAGIGFTMSIFIASLAFPGSELLDRAKMGILVASAIAAAAGTMILVARTSPPDPRGEEAGYTGAKDGAAETGPEDGGAAPGAPGTAGAGSERDAR